MLYSQDIISEVKSLNDIVDVVGVYVKLSPRAGNHFGLCPFHSEKSPSFSVNRDKQIFYCFGCGAGGNVISFIKRIENMDFVDALKLLADRAHFNLPEKGTSTQQDKIRAQARETAAKINKLAARFYFDNLQSDTDAAGRALEYLTNRGVTPSLIKRFGLGLATEAWDGLLREFPDIPPTDFETAGLVKRSEKTAGYYDRFRGRLMFPIIDNRGRVIGFGGRVLPESNNSDGASSDGTTASNRGKEVAPAKYINSPETELFKKSECLYGMNLAKKLRNINEIIVVEGYMDVLTMHMHGFVNTVGVLGTAMRATHARIIKNCGAHTAVLILDSDEAGIKAALRAIPVLVKENLKVKILQIPDAKDPDEFLTRFGAAKFSQVLASAKPYPDFQLDLARKKHDLTTIEGNDDFANEAVIIIAEIPSEITRELYLKKVASQTSISFSTLLAGVEKITGQARSEIFINPQNRRVKALGETGVKNAKKGLLNLLFSHENARQALQKDSHITGIEMGGGFHGQLLDFCLSAQAAFKPSDVFDSFETDDEHRAIAEIFADERKYASEAAVCKALNDMVKQILLFYLNSSIENEKNDLNAVNSMLFRKKAINSLNITLNECS